MSGVTTDVIDKSSDCSCNAVICSHGVEQVGTILRGHMGAMKSIAVGG